MKKKYLYIVGLFVAVISMQTFGQTTITPIDPTQSCTPIEGVCLAGDCFPGGGGIEIPCTGFFCTPDDTTTDCDSAIQSCVDSGRNADEGVCEGSDCGDNSCSATVNLASNSSGAENVATTNPINLISGNKYKRQEDIAPLPGVLGLEFVRHYNSSIGRSFGLGAGWRHSYSVGLLVLNGFAPGEMEFVKIQQSDGRILRFDRIGSKQAGAQYATRNNADGFITTSEVGYKWHWRNGRIFSFDDQGWLTEISQGKNILSLQYSAGGQLLWVEDPQGRRLSFSYNKGLLTKIVDPSGQRTRYKYAPGRQLLYVERPSGKTRFYHYENKEYTSNLTGITDEREIRIESYRYDEQGRAIVSTKGLAVDKVEVSYEENQRVVTNGLGESTTYLLEEINGQKIVKEIIGPGCSACSGSDVVYEYNDALQVIKKAHKNGVSEFYEYDERQRKTAYYRQYIGQEEKQLIESYEYAEKKSLPVAIKRPSIVEGEFYTTKLSYNAYGQITEMAEFGFAPRIPSSETANASRDYQKIQRRSTLTYNDRAQLIKVDGPRDDVNDHVLISYNENGYLNGFVLPSGQHKKVLSYDVYGRPTKLQQGEQTPIELTYNGFGKPLTITQGTIKFEYEYNELGNLVKVTDSLGVDIELNYDKAARLNKINKENGPSLEVDYDDESRIVQRRSLNQQGVALDTISYFYDAQNRLQRMMQNKEVTENGYDELGNLNEVKTSNGSFKLSDSPTDNILQVVQSSGATMDYYKGKNNQVVGVKDYNGNITRPIKDDFNRTVITRSPDAGDSYYQYDPAGNVVGITSASGIKSTYQYDSANRVITHQSPDANDEYAYHQTNGQLKSVKNKSALEEFSYDQDARMVGHKRIINGHEFETRYTYNELGQIETKTLPNNKTLKYQYHQDGSNKGRVKTVTQSAWFGLSEKILLSDIDSNHWDGQTSFEYANSLKTTSDYNERGRVKDIKTEGLLAFSYTYNNQGNVEQLGIEAESQSVNERYEYWGGQLYGVYSGQHQEKFTGYNYDQVGNRLSETTAKIGVKQPRSATERLRQTGSTDQQIEFDFTLYEYDANSNPKNNRLNAVISKDERKEYEYNEQGSPTKIAYTAYEYNSAQRPIKVYVGGELTAQYKYNAWGERVQKTTYRDGQIEDTYYLYEQQKLIAEADSNGKIIRQYLYQDAQLTGVWSEKDFYAVHTDQIGKPYRVTDDNKETVWLANYDVFGKAIADTDPDADGQVFDMPLRLPGQIEDYETGTYYNYLRDYDPLTGRYLTSDPLGFAGGINSYLYAQANPQRYIDPLGLQAVESFREVVVDAFDIATFSSDGCSPTGDLTLENLRSGIDELGVAQGASFSQDGSPVVLFAATTGELIHNNINGGLVQMFPNVTIGGAGDIATFNPNLNTGNLNSRNASLTDPELGAVGDLFGLIADPSREVMFTGFGSNGLLLLENNGSIDGLTIAISGDSSDAQIKDSLVRALGNLVTDEDVRGFRASLPDGTSDETVYAVNIGPLFAEIIARYQTRVHSDPAVVAADREVLVRELEFNSNRDLFNQRLEEEGLVRDGIGLSSIEGIPSGCFSGSLMFVEPCAELRSLLASENSSRMALEDAIESYGDVLVSVNDRLTNQEGFLPPIQAIQDQNSADLELLSDITLAVVGVFVPLTVTDAAIDLGTYGLGRIPRVGRAVERTFSAIRNGVRVISAPISNAAQGVAARIFATRYRTIFNNFTNIASRQRLTRYVDGLDLDDAFLRRLDDDIAANPELGRLLDENPLRLNIRIEVEDFLGQSRNIDDLIPSDLPTGYSLVRQADGSRYIRRLDASDPLTPRIGIDVNGNPVRYIAPARLSSNSALRNRLGQALGRAIPPGHQAHHLVPDNVVRNSPLHQEAINRGLYDLDRVSNGRLLAETADDFVDGVSSNLPTHLGQHRNYDEAVEMAIDDVLEASGVDANNLDGLFPSQIEMLIDEVEAAALQILENWGPSRLN